MIVNTLLALVVAFIFIAVMMGLIWLLVNAFAVVVMLLGFGVIFAMAYSFVDHMRNG